MTSWRSAVRVSYIPMPSLSGPAYLLAISLRELFPQAEILQVQSTPSCFFCDVQFPGEFNFTIMGFLEERMRAWVAKKEAFKVFEMVSNNAAQFLEHQGEKRLGKELRGKKDLITLIQLDRFFFQLDGEPPRSTNDFSFVKLACFWNLKNGIRILGTGSNSKEKLKEIIQQLKTQKDPQKRLEELGLVSWIENQLVWEAKAELLKDLLRKKIMTLYHGFDRVSIAVSSGLEDILVDWLRKRGKGFQFREKVLQWVSQEPWDSPVVFIDQSWGKIEELTSFLQLATKFLTMLKLDYQVVGIGKIVGKAKELIDLCFSSWNSEKGSPSRLELRAVDRLGRKWKISSLEWNQKLGFVQMSLCVSLERCIALMVDRFEVDSMETLLNRLK